MDIFHEKQLKNEVFHEKQVWACSSYLFLILLDYCYKKQAAIYSNMFMAVWRPLTSTHIRNSMYGCPPNGIKKHLILLVIGGKWGSFHAFFIIPVSCCLYLVLINAIETGVNATIMLKFNGIGVCCVEVRERPYYLIQSVRYCWIISKEMPV